MSDNTTAQFCIHMQMRSVVNNNATNDKSKEHENEHSTVSE